MSEEGIKNAEMTFNKPIEIKIVRRRSEFYAEWILSHPILWGWVLLATINTVADLLMFFHLLLVGFAHGFWDHAPPLFPSTCLLTIPIWSASIAWAKRFKWKQWIAFAAAWVLALAGILFGAVMVALSHFDMSSGPPAHKGSFLFDVLFPLLCTLPGLCWVVAILRKNKRN